MDPSMPSGHPTTVGPDADTLRLVVESVEDYAILTLDTHGNVRSWSRGAEVIKGYSEGEILGKHFSVFYPEEARNRGWPQEELRLAALHGSFEDEGLRVRKDGSEFWANVVITALRQPSGELIGFAKITRDLTERRRAAEELRQSEEMLRLLIEGVTEYAIFMLDLDGKVVSWNAGAARIKGYQREEILGQHFSVFYPPDDIAAGKPARELAYARRHGQTKDEGWRLRGDGALFWADVSITAIYDARHQLRGYAKVTRDVSDRRRLQELEISARRTRDFLATLSHELRNPLAPIRNAVTVMSLQSDVTPTIRTCVGLIDRQMIQLVRLVDDLLDVGRVTAGKFVLQREPVSLNDIVSAAIEGAHPSLDAHSQTVRVSLPAEPVVLDADRTRMVQVLQNLLHNASKFSPVGAEISIQAELLDRVICLHVADPGRGIAPSALESVFELFTQEARMHDVAEPGLGIGLALCRSLVHLHGGTVAAYSEGHGKGSRFTLRLPLGAPSQLPAGAAATGAFPDEVEAEAEGKTILIVDDNRDAADSLHEILKLSGYRC
jgi:PAS domain S-box-containing protein